VRIDVNGTKLFFDVEGPKLVPSGSTMVERPTVVLLHGGPGFDHSNFKPAFSRLAEVAQVVYVDHRGNGRSERGDPSSWTLDVWADDVRAFCEALEIERPVVLGWSFGGFVAMAYASRHPEHASRLILQSTAARLDLDVIVDAFRRIGGEDAATAAKAFWTTHDDESMVAYMQHCLSCYSPQPLDPDEMTRCVLNVDLLKGFAGEMEMDQTAALAAITCPTLVLSGALDPITPPAASDEIVSAMTDGVARLERFEQSGHFIHHTEPDRFFTILRDFITEPAS
jgi:pimeloyl-ACP methyl ester carboxylesterase